MTTLVHWDRMHSASPAARSTFTAQTPAVDPTMPGRRIDVIADNPNVSKGVVGAQGYLLPADAQTLDQVAAQSSVGGSAAATSLPEIVDGTSLGRGSLKL